jgi:purine-binding chemotaxis protein CheW
MPNSLQVVSSNSQDFLKAHEQFLLVKVNSQLFGIPVVRVRDVLKPQPITKIPLAKPCIMGFMNLRGRIVTAIDMHKRLSISSERENLKQMFVVIEVDDDLYCLKVDEVGDTRTLTLANFEKTPENLSSQWKEISKGVFKLEKELMVVLDVNNVIKI